jgi:predicted DsbA family dithiol-disulfide isomerase
MSALLGLSGAPLSVALDVRHPLAYLALRPAIAFGRERGTRVDFLPVEGHTLRAASEPGPDDDRGIRHKRHRAHMIAREIAVYAQAAGLVVREPYRDGSPRAAHLAWLWVRERAPEQLPAFLEELFRRYWALELDAGDLEAVGDLVRASGLDVAGFRDWVTREGKDRADRIAKALREAGVEAAPAYLVEDEIFYGRQHLPMIRWILAGRVGPGPI